MHMKFQKLQMQECIRARNATIRKAVQTEDRQVTKKELSVNKQNADGTYTYKNNCKVYAKVSSTVYLYSKPNTRTVWTSVDLKQRQLFDLD